MRTSTALFLLLTASAALGARNGLDLVPPMGWSNWENSGCNVNETYIRASAQALIDKGLFEVGYDIVEVDGPFLLASLLGRFARSCQIRRTANIQLDSLCTHSRQSLPACLLACLHALSRSRVFVAN